MSEMKNQGATEAVVSSEKDNKKKAPKEKRTGRKNNKKSKKLIGAAVVLLIAVTGAVVAQAYLKEAKPAAAGAAEQRTAIVTRGELISELSSSGTISPKNTYNITSLVEGEVILVDFEEGDLVEEGQVLYQIDVSSMESEVQSANNSLERAQNNYEQALSDYNEALSDYSGNTYKSTRSGFISVLNIEAGDKISSNTELATIYNDQTMKIKVPFLSGEAELIGIGNEGIITLSDTQEQIAGTVTSVSNMDEVLDGGRMVRYVTLEVANPGGLTTSHSATVTIGEFVSSLESNFEAITDTVMKADLSNTVEVAAVLVHEGDYVSAGTPIFRMTDKDADKIIRSYKDSVDSAQEKVESAQSNVDSKQDTYENYTITAPISGQVITKTSKMGDNISKSSNGSTTMAVIYDLSEYTFEMSVDELDVLNVKIGQSVEITADAIEGKTFSGKVTNISLESSQSNGVTNYPVTITLDEVGDLLPGMNVDGRIILDQAEDTLMIPVDALMRGNRVYIKDPAATGQPGNVPAGFRAVEVETGLINDEFIEIISGVAEGDEVYVAESTSNTTTFMMPGGQGGQGIRIEGGGQGGGNFGGSQGGGQGGPR